MDKNDTIFTVTFIISLSALLFFLGSSLTGNVIKDTMTCIDGDCYISCTADSDCINQICCEKNGQGVCESENNCESIYSVTIPMNDMELDLRRPDIESPLNHPNNNFNIELFSVLIAVTIIFGIAFFLHKHEQ